MSMEIFGKKNAASGSEVILAEVNVLGSNAASVIMNSGNYTRCTLTHSRTYEATCGQTKIIKNSCLRGTK